MAQCGRAAAAVAEMGGAVAQVEAAGGELAGGVVPPPLMSSSTLAASAVAAIWWVTQSGCAPHLNWEPVSGFEPLACRLQEVRHRAICALAAQMTRIIALMALAALGLSGTPSHEPSHARGPYVLSSHYCG